MSRPEGLVTGSISTGAGATSNAGTGGGPVTGVLPETGNRGIGCLSYSFFVSPAYACSSSSPTNLVTAETNGSFG